MIWLIEIKIIGGILFLIILPKGSGIKIVHLKERNSKPGNLDKY